MRLVRFEELQSEFGISYCRQHIRRLVGAKLFPAPVRLGGRSVFWIADEIRSFQQMAAEARSGDK